MPVIRRMKAPHGATVKVRKGQRVKAPKGSTITISTPGGKKKMPRLPMRRKLRRKLLKRKQARKRPVVGPARRPARPPVKWKSHGVVQGRVNVPAPRQIVRTKRFGVDIEQEVGVHVRSRKIRARNVKKGITI